MTLGSTTTIFCREKKKVQNAAEGLSTQACTKIETVFSMLKEIQPELPLALMSSCCKKEHAT